MYCCHTWILQIGRHKYVQAAGAYSHGHWMRSLSLQSLQFVFRPGLVEGRQAFSNVDRRSNLASAAEAQRLKELPEDRPQCWNRLTILWAANHQGCIEYRLGRCAMQLISVHQTTL